MVGAGEWSGVGVVGAGERSRVLGGGRVVVSRGGGGWRRRRRREVKI